MVASSEQQRAPVMVNKPATAHARSSQPGAPLSRDDSAEVMKIPEPIIEPITIIVASIGPSARTRPGPRGDDPPWGRTRCALRREGAPASFSDPADSIRISNYLSSRDTATPQLSRPALPAPRLAQRNAIFLSNFHWIEGTDRNIPVARWTASA